MSAPRFVHLNGALVPFDEARIRPDDRGFLLGDAVFETVRSYGGSPFALDEHLARLRRSCDVARIAFPTDLTSAVQAVLVANKLDEAAVRITVTRGPGGRGASPQGAGPPTVLVTATAVEPRPDVWTRGVRVVTAKRRRIAAASLDPGLKTTNYLVHVLAKMEAEEAGADDALFVDEDDMLVEATQANVFARFGKRLVTPPLSAGCLPGVTRAHLLALAPGLGYEAHERALAREELYEADEVFLTATVLEVAPVVELDAVRVGGGKPGPAARELHATYRAFARAEAGTETAKHRTQ